MLSLLELLLVLAIVLFLANKLYKIYFFQPLDNKTTGPLSGYGIDTQNYKTVLDSTRIKVQEINQQEEQRQKLIEAIE